MREETDAILRALGDLLLQLGCDTTWLVPNTSLNTKQLNLSVAQYQALLDRMEIEITAAIARAREKITEVTEPKKDDPDSVEEGAEEALNRDDQQTFGMDSLHDKYDDNLGNGLGDELDFYDMNRNDSMGMFDDMGDNGMRSTNLQAETGYDMIDDQFF